jgi:hypothetical protein
LNEKEIARRSPDQLDIVIQGGKLVAQENRVEEWLGLTTGVEDQNLKNSLAALSEPVLAHGQHQLTRNLPELTQSMKYTAKGPLVEEQ